MGGIKTRSGDQRSRRATLDVASQDSGTGDVDASGTDDVVSSQGCEVIQLGGSRSNGTGGPRRAGGVGVSFRRGSDLGGGSANGSVARFGRFRLVLVRTFPLVVDR